MDLGQGILALICLALIGGGFWLFISSFGRMKLRRAIEDTPTSKIRSAPMGKAELKGLGKVFGAPLTAPFSGVACLWHRWLVEEEKITRDSKGRVRKSWDHVAEGVSTDIFQLEDTTGEILVLPAGAEVDAPKVFSYTQGGVFSLGNTPGGPLFAAHRGHAFSGRRRFSEWRLDIQRPLYVLGVIRPARENERISVAKGRADEAFLISSKSEQELLDGMFWGVVGRMVFGAALSLGGMALAAHQYLGW